MEAYLDNAATTRVLEQVKDEMILTMMEDYGNPSSMHLMGVRAESYIKEAKKQIAGLLKAEEKEILFTSGGTESNNLALTGVAMACRRMGNHIITTSVEHASILNTMAFLSEQGFRVTYLPVDHYGVVDLDALEEAIDEDTILVSMMYVNNEVGAIMPVEEAAKIIRRKKPDILFHVDAIQAFGKFPIYPKRMGIDLLSVSGHKFHGPKGVGFLYIRDKTKIKPIIYGGGQQKGMRSGTENVPGIAGLAKAAGLVYDGLAEKIEKLYELKDEMITAFEQMENVRINSRKGKQGAPQIVNASFIGVRSEVLLHALEDQGIYVSAGSACSTNKHTASATLKNMGLSSDEMESAVRFSFSVNTTREEVEYAIDTIKKLLPVLRIYRRK